MAEEVPVVNADGTVVPPVAVVPPKVTYTDDQQNHLNGLINDAFERAFKKANDGFAPKLEALTTELAALKAKPAPPVVVPPVDDKPKPVDAKVAELQAQVDEMKSIADELRKAEATAKEQAKAAQQRGKKTRIKEEFIRAADKVDFFDRMDVFNLVEGQLDLDEADKVVILNPATNHPRQSVSGNMSIEEFISDFVKTKPHMVRSKAAAGGTGAEEARKVAETPTDKVDYAAMTDEQFKAFSDSVIAGAYKK